MNINLQFSGAGYGNQVALHRILAVVHANSAPMKRMINSAEAQNKLIVITQAKKTRSAIIFDSGHIVLSTLQPETLTSRLLTSTKGIESANLFDLVADEEGDDEN